MRDFCSTIKQPIKFFQDLILEDGYSIFRKAFFKIWEDKMDHEHPETNMFEIHKEEDYIVDFYKVLLENIPDDIRTFTYLKDELNKRIDMEYINSKNLILSAISEIAYNNNSSIEFLNSQNVIIQRLLLIGDNLFQNYPMCKVKLESISHYIKELTSDNNKENTKSISTSEYQTVTEAENDPFNEIIGYFTGKNEYNQQIMAESEYDKLIGMIHKVISHEEIKIDTKFDIKVPVGVLRYSFYVLHLRLFGKDKNDSFIKFLIDSILQFKDWEFKILKSKISVPPTVLPDYLPSIIKEQKQKQITKSK